MSRLEDDIDRIWGEDKHRPQKPDAPQPPVRIQPLPEFNGNQEIRTTMATMTDTINALVARLDSQSRQLAALSQRIDRVEQEIEQ